LSQVLLNLLNNAAKYSEQGGRIGLTAAREGDHVLIQVTDTGIGISAQMLPRIFEMFVQADRALERAEGGLGIGLTLVKMLAEVHGGRVQAHSDGPGKGSKFVVRLPVAMELEAQGPFETADDGRNVSSIPPSRVLVVDDNQDAAETLAVLLRIMG